MKHFIIVVIRIMTPIHSTSNTLHSTIFSKISETVIKYAKIKDSFRFCEFHLQYDICIMIISLLGAIMEGDICIF